MQSALWLWIFFLVLFVFFSVFLIWRYSRHNVYRFSSVFEGLELG